VGGEKGKGRVEKEGEREGGERRGKVKGIKIGTVRRITPIVLVRASMVLMKLRARAK